MLAHVLRRCDGFRARLLILKRNLIVGFAFVKDNDAGFNVRINKGFPRNANVILTVIFIF